jgi:hypothetical protein
VRVCLLYEYLGRYAVRLQARWVACVCKNELRRGVCVCVCVGARFTLFLDFLHIFSSNFTLFPPLYLLPRFEKLESGNTKECASFSPRSLAELGKLRERPSYPIIHRLPDRGILACVVRCLLPVVRRAANH